MRYLCGLEMFWFERSDVEQTFVKCKICRKSVATDSGSTTNLFQRLWQRHQAAWEKCSKLRDEDKLSLSARAVAFHITKVMVPIYIIEKPGFIKMLHTADPRYKLPSNKYFKYVCIPWMYSETCDKVSEQLEKASSFSMTTDLWSSRTIQPYMSLTAHYVDAKWKLQSFCLQTYSSAWIPV